MRVVMYFFSGIGIAFQNPLELNLVWFLQIMVEHSRAAFKASSNSFVV